MTTKHSQQSGSCAPSGNGAQGSGTPHQQELVKWYLQKFNRFKIDIAREQESHGSRIDFDCFLSALMLETATAARVDGITRECFLENLGRAWDAADAAGARARRIVSRYQEGAR